MTNGKSRTSRPRLVVIRRSALAWFQAEISRMPGGAVLQGQPERLGHRADRRCAAASASSGISPPSRCGGIRPSTVRVGDGGFGAAQPVAGGPGSAPAERGPTLSVPSGDTQATDPPPAPTVTTSTIGIFAGNGADRAFGGQRGPTVGDHRDVGGGSAAVAGQHATGSRRWRR